MVSAVQGELHVPGARRLVPGGGDLFGEIRGGVDALGVFHVQVGQEDHPQAAAHVAIVVDDLAHAVDEADDKFRLHVARGRLAREDDRARCFRAVQVQLQAPV